MNPQKPLTQRLPRVPGSHPHDDGHEELTTCEMDYAARMAGVLLNAGPGGYPLRSANRETLLGICIGVAEGWFTLRLDSGDDWTLHAVHRDHAPAANTDAEGE